MFGKTDMVKESETIGRSNDSINISGQKEELMPVCRIGTLSQGEFIGKVLTHSSTRYGRSSSAQGYSGMERLLKRR